MIIKLGEESNDLHLFIHTIWGHSEILKKKTAYVNCVDDLADAYWCLKTTVKKENISCLVPSTHRFRRSQPDGELSQVPG